MKLRMPDEDLESGDIAVHDEEAYPDETLIGARAGAPASEGIVAENGGTAPRPRWRERFSRRSRMTRGR